MYYNYHSLRMHAFLRIEENLDKTFYPLFHIMDKKIRLNIILSSGKNIIIESDNNNPDNIISIPFILYKMHRLDKDIISIDDIIKNKITFKIMFDDKLITYNYNKQIYNCSHNTNKQENENKKLLLNYIKSNNNCLIDLQIIYCNENY